jgi:hypothetical protein
MVRANEISLQYTLPIDIQKPCRVFMVANRAIRWLEMAAATPPLGRVHFCWGDVVKGKPDAIPNQGFKIVQDHLFSAGVLFETKLPYTRSVKEPFENDDIEHTKYLTFYYPIRG